MGLRFVGLVLALGVLGLAPLSAWPHWTCLEAQGSEVAAGGRSGEVYLLDAASGEVEGRWTLPEAPVVMALVPSPSGWTAWGADGRGWVLQAQQLPVPASGTAPTPSSSPLRSGVTRTQGERKAEGSPQGQVTFTPVSGAPLRWSAASAAITGLVFVGDDLISAAYDGTLSRWDAATGIPRGRL